jgi:cytochrome c peroxidase
MDQFSGGRPWGGEAFDVRRYYVSHDKKDIGAFKTPPLREVSRTTPYMHDGRFVTLKQVVDHHNHGSVKNQFLDNQVIPLNLSESEKQDLVEMLRSLNGEGWKHAKAPLSFPE